MSLNKLKLKEINPKMGKGKKAKILGLTEFLVWLKIVEI